MTDKQVPFIFQKNITRKTDSEILADKAAQVLADLTDDYLVQVRKDIQIMYTALDKAEMGDPQKRGELLMDAFFVKMHDLKGQGATFGYPLLTDIGTFVCNYLRNRKGISLLDLTFLKQCVTDADTIVQKNLTGDGGSIGEEIRKRLTE